MARKSMSVFWRLRDMPMFGDPFWLRGRLGGRLARYAPQREEAGSPCLHDEAAQFVGAWCERFPIAHIYQLTGLHWKTVRCTDRPRLQHKMDQLPVQPCGAWSWTSSRTTSGSLCRGDAGCLNPAAGLESARGVAARRCVRSSLDRERAMLPADRSGSDRHEHRIRSAGPDALATARPSPTICFT